MKKLNILLSTSLILFGITAVTPVLAETTESSRTQLTNLTEGEVLALMDVIVIQDFNIEKVSLSQAIAHLDTVLEPHGLQLLFERNGTTDPVVNLKTRSLSLTNNLSYLCKQGSYEWRVESGVVVIGPRGAGEQMFTEIFYINSPTVSRLAAAGRQ